MSSIYDKCFNINVIPHRYQFIINFILIVCKIYSCSYSPYFILYTNQHLPKAKRKNSIFVHVSIFSFSLSLSIHFTVRLLHCHLLNLRFGLEMNSFSPNQKLLVVENIQRIQNTIEQIMFTFELRFVFTLSLVLFKPIIGKKIYRHQNASFQFWGLHCIGNGWKNIKYCTLNSMLQRATKKEEKKNSPYAFVAFLPG